MRRSFIHSFKQILAQGYVMATHPLPEGRISQQISNVVWSCAKLRICPEDHELVAYLAAMAKPSILQHTSSQQFANLMYAVSEFERQNGIWRSPIKPAIWQKLLSEQWLASVADHANSQELTNSLLALARMATCQHQVITKEFAQHCVARLLQGRTAQLVGTWNAQDVGNTMWSLAMLGLDQHTEILHELSATVESWLPRRLSIISLQQVAWACLELGHTDQLLIEHVLKGTLLQVRALVEGQRGGAPSQYWQYKQVAALLASLVVVADLCHLAADARGLVTLAFSACGRKSPSLTKSDAARLWCLHNWLANNRLLDGVGLRDALTRDQLAYCEEAANMSV